MDGYMGYYDFGYGHMLVGLLFWIFIIAGTILVIKWFTDQSKNREEAKEEASALEVAKIRYANGEITKEEFEEIKKNII
ncbi:MAG: putative membrane protein [Methanohalophilus sp. T328-1]|jgi:putative membrane protein|nr:MAG: putative membrane protein [Methanohalophilus sp. T328-1]